ncbi:MAG: cytochrome c [Planctomycetales bacterium]|nr:cytochrome c [Planctomycetales bacterium]
MQPPLPLAHCLLALTLVALTTLPAAANPRVRRSEPPQTWDPETERLFSSDPLEMLKGTRPAAGARPPAGPSARSGRDLPDQGSSSSPFAWADRISGEVIADEIKAQRLTVADSVKSPAVFKGGGNRKLRDQFSVIAAMFGITAQYNADIRWKEIAPAARDSFAKAARNAKSGDDPSFRESKLRSEDLDELVRGGAVEFAEPEEKVLWSEVAERRPLMKRLKEAHESRLRPWTANQGEFDRNLSNIRHEAEILAALAEVIKQPEYEFYDDDDYIEYCDQLQREATRLVRAAREKNLAETQQAVGQISQACDACHEEFR